MDLVNVLGLLFVLFALVLLAFVFYRYPPTRCQRKKEKQAPKQADDDEIFNPTIAAPGAGTSHTVKTNPNEAALKPEAEV